MRFNSTASLKMLVLYLCWFWTGDVGAVRGINVTDQWWNPNESGWGIAILHQRDVLFVDLFVYGPDNKPTWYTATAYVQPPGSAGSRYVGDLNATTGPYFGAGTFSPGQTTVRKVGTLTLDFSSANTGTLSYGVDGVAVVKQITRQLLANDNFTWEYYGGLVYDTTQCIDPRNNGHVEELGSFYFNSFGEQVGLGWQSSLAKCQGTALYSQAGHMGSMQGQYFCDNGVSGTFNASEMELTRSGMTGIISGQNNLCQFSGHLGGVKRP